jgi:hypothetical protein
MMSLATTPKNTIETLTLRVDFARPKQYDKTRPIFCSINGKTVAFDKEEWIELLIAIIAWFTSGVDPDIVPLDKNFSPERPVPFMLHDDPSLECVQIPTGRWIYKNFIPKAIVECIKILCGYCGVKLEDVVIEVVSNKRECNRSTSLKTNTPADVALLSTTEFPPEFIKRLREILAEKFPKGFRTASHIELSCFRKFADNNLSTPEFISDEELERAIVYSGILFDGKVYIVPAAAQERIKRSAEQYFNSGAEIIFYSEFYTKNEKWLFEANVISEGMLVNILKEIFPLLTFTAVYFGNIGEAVGTALSKEILRVWGEDIVLTYGQIAERLKYVPIARIMATLAQSGCFLWCSVGVYSHIGKVSLLESEREAVRKAVRDGCDACGYFPAADMLLGEVMERNDKLSPAAIHEGVFQLCLADEYCKNGKIIAPKGAALNVLKIMRDCCASIDRCTLADLFQLEQKLTGEKHGHHPMEAGYSVLVRIDRDTFVAEKYLNFDSEAIDKAICGFVAGEYLPLKSFTTFAGFPYCGQAWNPFLLESYCRRFSIEFRFDCPAANSQNAGAVIRKSCGLSYTDIMADAVAKSGVLLSDKETTLFLYESGFIGRNRTAKIAEVIEKAKNIKRGL